MLRLWIGRALLWLLLPAQIEQAKRANRSMANGGHRQCLLPAITDRPDKEHA